MDPAATPKPRKWRVAVALVLSGTLILLGGIIGGKYQQRKAQQKYDRWRDGIRAQGYPVTAVELDAFYPTPPDGQNAASLYARAFAIVAAPPADARWIGYLRRSTNGHPPFTADLRADLSVYIQTNSEALKLLHKASQIPACRYPVKLRDGFDTLFPHLAPLKNSVTLLGAEALHHALENRPDKAVEALQTGLSVSVTLTNEPNLLSFLVQNSASESLARSTETLVNYFDLPPSALQLLADMLEHAEKSLTIKPSLAGDRVLRLDDFNGRAAKAASSASFPDLRQKDEIRRWLYSCFGYQYHDRLAFIALWEKVWQACELPVGPEMLDKLLEADDELERIEKSDSLKTAITRIAMGYYSMMGQKYAQTVAELRCAQVGLMLLKYRQENEGKLPETLEVLVPQYLAEIPADPFTGRHLGYYADQQVARVWSIGRDRIDQGGKQRPYGYQNDDYDLVFSIERHNK